MESPKFKKVIINEAHQITCCVNWKLDRINTGKYTGVYTDQKLH